MVSRSQEVSTDAEQILHDTVNRAVIRVLIGAVKHRRHHRATGGRVTAQLVGDQAPRPGGTSMVPPFLLYRGAQVWRLPQPTVCRGSRPATSIHDRAYQHSSRQHRGGDHLKIGERARARQDGSSF